MSPLLGRTDHAARTLPIAPSATVRAHTKVLLRDHRGPLSWVLGWHVVAALVALVGPWVIGQVVQEVTTGDGSLGRIDLLIALLVAAIVVQTVLTWVARRASFVLSERIFARLREDFITSLGAPAAVRRRAGRHRRPRRAHDQRRRVARAHHPLRHPGDRRRGDHGGGDDRGGVPHLAAGRALAAHRRAGARADVALVPQARRRRLPVGARVLRPAQRGRLRDRRGRAHDGRPRAAGGPGSALPGRPGRVRRRRAVHPGPAAALVPVARDRLLPADRDRGALGRVAGLERAHHDRRGHRRHALRAAAARPAR